MDFIFRLRNLVNREHFSVLVSYLHILCVVVLNLIIPHSLVIEVVSLAMHLVFQCEIKSDMLHSFLGEGLCL